MAYSVKLNGVALDATKVENKSINSLSISADDMLFSAKASMLRFSYRDCDESDLTFPNEIDIIEIYQGVSLYWCGYVQKNTIQYKKRKRQYTFTCYDLMKLLPEITMNSFAKVGDYFGRPLSAVVTGLKSKINDYLHDKTYEGFEITSDCDEEASDIEIDYDITGGYDDNAMHDFDSSTFKFAKVNDLIVFWYQKNGDVGSVFRYFGVLQGTRVFFFMDSAGDWKRYTSPYNSTSQPFYVTRNDEAICFYCPFEHGGTQHWFAGIEFDNDGEIIQEDDTLVYIGEVGSVDPDDYALRYDASGDLEVFEGSRNEFSTTETVNGADYTVGTDVINIDGTMTPNLDFPYAYNEDESDSDYEVSVYRILQDLAITFNGFFSLYKKELHFITQDITTYTSYNSSSFTMIDEDVKYCDDLEYELSDTLAEEYEDFISYLESFYTTNYGGKNQKIKLKFRTTTVLNLLCKIDSNRINQIKRKEISSGYYEYQVETLKLVGSS